MALQSASTVRAAALRSRALIFVSVILQLAVD
jgi:hypothetical protein